MAVKNLQRSFKKKEAIHFQTIEDHNGNFLAGLERRKLQKKFKFPTSAMAAISPLGEGLDSRQHWPRYRAQASSADPAVFLG